MLLSLIMTKFVQALGFVLTIVVGMSPEIVVVIFGRSFKALLSFNLAMLIVGSFCVLFHQYITFYSLTALILFGGVLGLLSLAGKSIIKRLMA